MKLYFHPGTDMAQAMAETVHYVNRARAFMPPGTVAAVRDALRHRQRAGRLPGAFERDQDASARSRTRRCSRVRPMFASLPGVSAPPPFGGNQRTIVVHVDPDRLRSYNLSPDDVVAALNAGNTISPSGNVRIKDQMPIVPVNAMVTDPRNWATSRSGWARTSICATSATIEDGTDIPTGYALVNGRRAVYMLVTKRADASTLSRRQRREGQLAQDAGRAARDIDVSFEFDQSPYVTRCHRGRRRSEGLLGAVLTGLMVLLFLRDWRSVLVVVLNIPLALLAAVVALWLTGQTINLMTLGGLALAVGILVDEATVEVENIHAQMAHSR